jgi:hypothetical protein
MTPEEELEWLKRKYGLADLDSETKALMNLDKALKTKKIDRNTYENEKKNLNDILYSIFDNCKTQSCGVLEVIQTMTIPKWMSKRLLCTYCEHYGTGLIDAGYGCGYRNTQMLLSSIRKNSKLRDILFNNSNIYIFFVILRELIFILFF